MYKPQAFSEKSTNRTPAFFTLRELSALTGISKGAIYHAVAKGNSYFRAWIRSEEGSWDFEAVNPNDKKPRRRFYRVS